jgi:exodeoxyribonuclease V alpha subunit
MTIHRGLGYIPPDEWTYNEENKLDCDVLAIDEFSMTDIFLFRHVIDALDFGRTKLLIIGDNAQLPSVSCGNLLHDFMHSNIIPTVTLTKVFRYGEGGLMKVATDVRNCKKYLDKDIMQQCTFFGNNKDYAFINVSSELIVKNVVALYQKLLSQGYKVEDIQVLTAYNKGEYGSIALNNNLQKIANNNYGTVGLKCGEVTYYEGDLIIQTVNNYKAQIYVDDEWCFGIEDKDETFIANGEIGRILKIGMHDMIIDFDGTKIKYTRDDLQGIKLGYSISIHKSQGGSARIVILLTPQAHTFMLNSNIIYVGLTRMKEKCFHLGNVDTVNAAIKKKENFNRMTFMKELLRIK